MKNQVSKSVSQSAIQKPEKSQTHKTPEKHGIPRNVNYYSHFLAEPYITEKDIEFVLQLRNMDNAEMASKLARIPNQVFSRGDQKIESQKQKHLSRDVNYKGNSSLILHLMKGRIGPTPHLSQAEFETGLRSYARTDKSLIEKERNWTAVPKTNRKDIFPEFLPNYKEEMQKRKSLSISGNKLAKLTYSGIVGLIYKIYFFQHSLVRIKKELKPEMRFKYINPQIKIQQSSQSKDLMMNDRTEDKQLFNYSSVMALKCYKCTVNVRINDFFLINYLKMIYSFTFGFNQEVQGSNQIYYTALNSSVMLFDCWIGLFSRISMKGQSSQNCYTSLNRMIKQTN